MVLLGHVAWWLRVSNALHATAWPRGLVRLGALAAQGLAGAGLLLWAWGLVNPQGWRPHPGWQSSLERILTPVGLYELFCVLWAGRTLGAWLWTRLRPCTTVLKQQRALAYHRFLIPRHRVREHATSSGAAGLVHSWKASLLALPGNESLDLEVNEKHLLVPGLPRELHRWRVVHVSDWHLTGWVPLEYFQRVIDHLNALEPHLVAITGDLIDREGCLPWLEELLGRIRCPLGVFSVRGNHDRRVNQLRLQESLGGLPGFSLLDGGGRMVWADGVPVWIAGSAWPWFGPRPPAGSPDAAFSLLLSHSPDEFYWAARSGYHLVLAGHVHGGQIRLPVVGAVVAPSRYGTRFASGVFCRGQTVMHVTRGLSAKLPLRWGCPPELTCLVLHAD